MSVKTNGTEVNADNDLPAISADGRFVAFQSVGRFTPGDAGTDGDVFVHNRQTGATRRASVKSNGVEVNTADGSEEASISADGRLVAFVSDAALSNGDTNGTLDVYVHDFKNGTTRRMSLTSSGQQVLTDSESPSISANGRYVAFQSDGAFAPGDTNGVSDVYVRDRSTGKTRRASVRAMGQPTEDSTDPAISGDGRYVAFVTSDGEMTADPDYGNFPLLDPDVFVRDTSTNTTSRVSLTSTENEADPSGQVASTDPAISANGALVTFISRGKFAPADTNGTFQDVYVRNLTATTTTLVSVKSNGVAGNNDSGVAAPAPLSANGRYVAFESVADLVATDGNGFRDVYMRDRTAKTTQRISVKSNGGAVSANHQEPAISGDGRFVAFASLGAFTNADSGNDFDVFERGPLH